MKTNLLLKVVRREQNGAHTVATVDRHTYLLEGVLLDVGSYYYITNCDVDSISIKILPESQVHKVERVWDATEEATQLWTMINDEQVTLADFAKYLALNQQ